MKSDKEALVMSQFDTKINKSLHVSEDVVVDIIANAAMEVDGVASIAPAKRNPAKLIIKDKNTKDIKIELAGDVLAVSIGIIIKSTARAVATAEEVQNKVKSNVQNMLNLTVTKVNVNIRDTAAEE
ncbi:MAG: Asp23/Gls24 family envelope stress response protein [Ruminococcus sp.]|nr:Asp23/Gls24 family envelope stress response protein [Ruminococcus sp.]